MSTYTKEYTHKTRQQQKKINESIMKAFTTETEGKNFEERGAITIKEKGEVIALGEVD